MSSYQFVNTLAQCYAENQQAAAAQNQDYYNMNYPNCYSPNLANHPQYGQYSLMMSGQAAAAAVSPTTDPPTGYAVSTRRKVFAVTQKQQATSPFSSNSGAGANKVNQNSTSPNSTDNMPHRSLPKPPEIPSGASGGYAATSRGGGSGSTSSYVPRHAKGGTHDITDYSHLRHRVLVGLLGNYEISILGE